MNKITKASIATAAGVALLLGGAGTFASWNAIATHTPQDVVVAGNLKVTSDDQGGTWTANGAATPIDIAGYAVSPGDVLTYTKTMQIEAEGDSLEAQLALTGGSIAPVKADNTDQQFANDVLAGLLNAEAKLAVATEDKRITDNRDGSFTVTPGGGVISEDVTVTVTIAFPNGAAGADNAAMNGSVDLSAMTVSLTQATD
ncbi:alternate-type signal peptide domain-containing protein [Microbacterium sp. zg.Y625]|uniref:alternate-type signal peptide domain-containing protein n=1 Tax=Microbacterium jiangjiandongii TaxID=3049071 RepID=UPI00214CC07F|nr:MULTISPECIES: alternate-type signal peptide domain-containing protein [unclassified Microbacterium]MCR2793304.1 alternate-type signal peptide domain-containing protein [Microbacterium sp. zg.Y625]WIM25320.1 alternate-type signal peptide domain-containing protein [Microbacterium sp. zg-Y625]